MTLATKYSRTAKLQDLVFFQRGFDITQAQQTPGPFPVISSSGVTSYHNEYRATGPGVVIGRKGTLGSVHYSESDYWPHDTTLWSKDLRGNDPRFVYYYLHTINLRRFDVGNSNPTLNRNHIHDLPVLIPPLDSQRRIVDILSAYDDLIENNRRRTALLEDAPRQLYREWFVRLRFPGYEHTPITNGVPEGWEKGCVADFYDTTSGGTPSRNTPEYFTGMIPWVKTQELSNDFITETEEKITEEALTKSSAKLLPERTVLVALYGATVGRLGILALPAATNQACCAVFPKDPRAHYIHAFLFFRENKERLVGLSAGAAQRNISQQIVRSIEMVMPSKRILEAFIDSLIPAFEQWLSLQRSIEKLRAARDLLLPRLMSGKIAV